jgi:hypothetical protein
MSLIAMEILLYFSLSASGASSSSRTDYDVTYVLTDFHILDEAILSTSDFNTINSLYCKLQKKAWAEWLLRRGTILTALEKVHDFYIEMNWKFQSSGILYPLVAFMAPSDRYRIWKRGSWIRVDSTIAGMGRFSIRKGNITTLFIGNHKDRDDDSGNDNSNLISNNSCNEQKVAAKTDVGDLFKIDRDKRQYRMVSP